MNEEITLLRNIKRLRKSRGITGEGLAEMIGMSYSYVRKFESGQVNPSYKLISDISQAFNVSISELFSEDNSVGRLVPLGSDSYLSVKSLSEMLSNNHEIITLMAQLPKDSPAFEMIKDLLEGAIEDQKDRNDKDEAL